MNSTTHCIDEQIIEHIEDFQEKWGETLAVQYPDLMEPLGEITDLLIERDRLLSKQLK